MSIDIFNLNYEFCSKKFNNLSNNKDALPKPGVFIRIFSMFKWLYLSGLKEFSKNKKQIIPLHSTLFLCISNNEFLSVESIVKKSNKYFVIGKDEHKNDFPFFKIYLFSFLYIPKVFFYTLFIKDKYHKLSIPYAFDGLCLSYSSNYILRKYLKKIRPDILVVTNHLNVYHRTLAYVAKSLKIKTIYIQHASITDNFPSISEFDVAILEGCDSYNKYEKNLISTCKIHLAGMSKFDKYYKYIKKNKYIKIKNIGICVNGMDDFDFISKLILDLHRSTSNQVTINIRPHPAYREIARFIDISLNHSNINFSDFKSEKSFDFLHKNDLIISGDSNIHLEAALINIPSVYYDPQMLRKDWYGFLNRKLVYYATNSIEILKIIDQISKFENPDFRSNAKYFVDTVNTKYDGNSTDLIFSLIENYRDLSLRKNENIFN